LLNALYVSHITCFICYMFQILYVLCATSFTDCSFYIIFVLQVIYQTLWFSVYFMLNKIYFSYIICSTYCMFHTMRISKIASYCMLQKLYVLDKKCFIQYRLQIFFVSHIICLIYCIFQKLYNSNNICSIYWMLYIFHVSHIEFSYVYVSYILCITHCIFPTLFFSYHVCFTYCMFNTLYILYIGCLTEYSYKQYMFHELFVP